MGTVEVAQDIALNLNGFEKTKAGRAVLNYGQISTNLNSEQFFRLPLTFSICKVGDCGLQNYQTVENLKRATTVEFTTFSPILYIHC
ncbi:MAG TPA: hypothetical protein DCE80_20500 [Ignavibacteriales bacterium]|nr:hypothetical protein [Ignavibacteriales bacterium]